jgi:hypothetical protein
MTITPTALTRGAAAAAVAAGVIFIGVQLGHPHLDATTVGSTEVVLRDSFKTLMSALALAGLTGIYLRQVRQVGVLGLVGYLVLSTGYLLMLSTTFIAATVLPALATAEPGYVNDVIATSTGGSPTGDVGLFQTVGRIRDVAYLGGGLILGIALFRARVLARWAAALLAVGGVVTVALSLLPDLFYRLLAFPNGIAMIGLGLSLWHTTRANPAGHTDAADRPARASHVSSAGAR